MPRTYIATAFQPTIITMGMSGEIAWMCRYTRTRNTKMNAKPR